MKTVSEYKCKLPDYAMSYLINNDDSGLLDDDKRIIDEYMRQFYDEAKENSGHVIIGIDQDCKEPYFTWHPDFGLACNVFDCTILIVN